MSNLCGATAPIAITGSYADFRLVKSRGIAQLVIEVPIEQAKAAIDMLGVPQPGQEVAVAVARLVTEQKAAPEPARVEAARERGKETYRNADEMAQAVTRASLLCKKEDFWNILERELGDRRILDDRAAADALRILLGVNSRSEIGTNRPAYEAFLALETAHKIASGQMAEPR